MFKKNSEPAIERLAKKKLESDLYKKVAQDINDNNIDQGLWTKAFVNSEGNEPKQKALYIQYMVDALLTELEADEEIQIIREEEQRIKAKAQAEIDQIKSELKKEQDIMDAYQMELQKEREKFKRDQLERDRKIKEGFKV